MHTKLFALSSFILSSHLFGAALSQEIKNPSLIVYNDNIGVVHEEREVTLELNDTQIVYENVAKSINTDSINVKLDPNIQLKSQQYRFDKLTQEKLLDAHIGKKVEFRRLKHAGEYEILPATLLAHQGEESIVKTLDYQILSVQSSSIIFESIPNELITKPSLVWNIKTHKALQTDISLDYLINNIGFKSNYILNLDTNNSTLSGWITIDNRSGKSFHNTTLSLLAGDINRVQNPEIYTRAKEHLVYASNTPEIKQQAFEEYHFYSVPFKVSLANNEKTQIKFLQKNDLNVTKIYKTQLNNPLYVQQQIKGKVLQYATFSGLDVPLPKGIVRSYAKLEEKTILLGESQLEHTPKQQHIELLLGQNFDLQIIQEPLKRETRQNWISCDIAYSIKNNSSEVKKVTLEIPFNNESDSIINTTQNYTLTKGNLVTFTLLVSPETTEQFNVHYESKR
ncbi:MAG: hypothetical protein JXQ67_03800 [Campylobacterales bacterium]|nr:hypothetical protein [Campylobacterales bacterium]